MIIGYTLQETNMELESRYINALELILELENIDLIRIMGVSLLNHRENHDISEKESASLNEALDEIVRLMLADGEHKGHEITDNEADELIDRANEITYNGSNMDIINALFTNDETNQPANEAECWVAYG